jgi:cytochrome c-type biogenesis protein CcmH/NrfG
MFKVCRASEATEEQQTLRERERVIAECRLTEKAFKSSVGIAADSRAFKRRRRRRRRRKSKEEQGKQWSDD